MRSRRWPHQVVIALAIAVAWRDAAGQGGSGSAATARPSTAAPSTVAPAPPIVPAAGAPNGLPNKDGTADIPDWTPGPAKFAVTPFENHVVRGSALDWLVAGAPFEIAEKTETVLGLDPTNPPLYVYGEQVPAEPDTVGAFGARVGASFVITGWFDRPGQDLRIDMIVWKVTGKTAAIAGEAQRMGSAAAYHVLLAGAMGDAWTKAGVTVDVARADRLARPLGPDVTPALLANRLYAISLMGRGLGHFTGALEAMASAAAVGSGSGAGATIAMVSDLKSAEKDLERAAFVDPKLSDAQRLIGELYMATAFGDAKLVSRASGKFNYANDLAPDDIASLRAAAYAMAAAAKWDVALDLFRKLVTRRPWDVEARYQLGAAMWQVGDAKAAERQLEIVTARTPDHLAARRVLVLIHASRSDTAKLVSELEAIARRAPNDLDVKADLATAYGALAQWPKAIASLEAIAEIRPNDLPLLVRIGDDHRKNHDLDGALDWYARAQRLAPESSLPGFATAQSLYDANRLAEANRAYTGLQRYIADLPAAEQALGAIALLQNRPDDAAWYLRRAVREAPRSLPTRQAVIAAELMRKDPTAAIAQLEPALAAWPDDGVLYYLAGIAHQLAGDATAARAALTAALQVAPTLQAARSALGALDAGGSVTLEFKPELVRPWGDADAVQVMLDRYTQLSATMATLRTDYQAQLLDLLGTLGIGPSARVKPGSVKTCPVGRMAKPWAAAQAGLARYARLGVDLEAAYRFIIRHDEAGTTAGLLPNARIAVANVKKSFRLALADIGELRAEWTRALGPELRVVGCTDKLLAAAVADPSRYHVIEEDQAETVPTQAPPRAKPRTTFFVDNTRCADPVDVWIDGGQVGQVAPGRRSALVADGGERTLCLLGPGAAQCGDRGTVRLVYLHDGWSVTMHCPK
jgi:tetratricopeptide (TPR) repeat protein